MTKQTILLSNVPELVIDMDSAREKQQLLTHIRELRGQHRVQITRYRKRRSDRQNAFYWGVVISLFADWARGEGNEVTDDECHEFLKAKFLTKPLVKQETGEIIGDAVRSTASLTTTEFNEYIEKCAAYLAEFCGITVPEPNL